ncbi:Nn.00g058660.m01.CDS01 [Neocucurbitaria sp. VM-36]
MTLFASFFLLGLVSCCLAFHQRNVARDSIALIPSASPTRPAVPSATVQAESRKHSKHVNDFFKLYGWIEPGRSVPDSDLPKAIRKIQKVLKEPITGVFSAKMMDIMNRPRCGTEQPYNETDAKTSPDLQKRYVLWGSKWAKATLTWRFINYSADVSVAQQQSTVSAAFAQWMRFMPLSIVPANNNANADINIRFMSFGRDDTRYAYTSMVSDGVSLSAGNINVTFNDDYQWNDDRLFNYTAVHEIGHALGLSHSAVESAVMFAYFEGNIRPIHPDDKLGIHSVYGWKNPKWSRIDSNTATKNMIQITSISNSVAVNDGLYQIRSSGQILRYASGTWTSVDNNKDTVQIAGSGGKLYQRHADGSTFRWTGSNSDWQYIGTASDNVIDIVAASDQIYSRRKDGWVARWSGSGTTWLSIEQPSAQVSKQIAITDSKTLWNLLTTGDLVRSYWPYNSGEWLIVDQNAANVAIAVGGDDFYKLQNDGTVVWLNPKEYYWQTIESAGSVAIYAQGDYLYSRHRDGTVWRYTGTSGVWEMLDDRKDVSSVVGDRSGEVWEMLTNGDIYKLVS